MGGTRVVTKADNVDVDVSDEDGCFELLRRLAKQNGLKPTDCELDVKTGRTKKTYRM
jgi:hypothetical protein